MIKSTNKTAQKNRSRQSFAAIFKFAFIVASLISWSVATPIESALASSPNVNASAKNAATAPSESDVEVRLSSREAYVGSPILLEIEVINPESTDPPQLPEVDGLKIELAGTPAQRLEQTIVNGRYSEKKSLTFAFQVTALKEGQYRLPAFDVEAGDQTHRVDSVSFVATKSETGDLLFVEVVGDQDSAYVGQQVNLSLKIWIKPFEDRQRNVRLSEGDMWNCISQATAWGAFGDRMNELAANGQRPGGEEVLKKDHAGVQRSYYLYQIDAPIYPTAPGSLNMDDVRIVVDYPTKLGVRQSPFGSLMRSPGSRFDDAFFGSPFGNRLVIAQQRPIVGEVSVDNTQIIPVPTEGQPAGYQGAVGQYDISVSVGKADARVGEPLPLQIDIRGNGRMDLVQPPRLDQVQALTRSFRVPSQALAGTVMGPVKYFDTTIRPLNENVKEIPPIPFSFFDPETKEYKTVFSEPIPIHVSPGETLSLDAIVADQKRSTPDKEDPAITISSLSDWSLLTGGVQPNFDNQYSAEMLSQQTSSRGIGWPWFAIGPVVFLIAVLLRWRKLPSLTMQSLRSSDQRLQQDLQSAKTAIMIKNALTSFAIESCRQKLRNSPTSNNDTSSIHAVGGIRLIGAYQLAARFESFFQRCENSGDQTALQVLKEEANVLARQLKREIKHSRPVLPNTKPTALRLSGSSLVRFWLAALVGSLLIASGATSSLAAMTIDAEPDSSQNIQQQRAAVLQEATQLYQASLQEEQQWRDQADDATAEVPSSLQQQFAAAATKYQWVVDSGVNNQALYLATGNAYAKSQQLGRAIWNYQKGLQLNSTHAQLNANLNWANSEVKTTSQNTNLTTMESVANWTRNSPWSLRLLVLLGLLFWGSLTAIVFGVAIPKWIPISLLAAQLMGGCLALTADSHDMGVVLVPELELHQSDGDLFPVVSTLKESDGRQLPVVSSRGDWLELEYAESQTGWVHQSKVGLSNLPPASKP